MKLYDVRSFDKGPFDTLTVPEVNEDFCGIEFSNDGKLMLLSTVANRHLLLDAYNGDVLQVLTPIPSEDGVAMPASLSPDGAYVVAGCGSRRIR